MWPFVEFPPPFTHVHMHLIAYVGIMRKSFEKCGFMTYLSNYEHILKIWSFWLLQFYW